MIYASDLEFDKLELVVLSSLYCLMVLTVLQRLTLKISKAIFILLPCLVEIHRAIFSSLNDCLSVA